MTPLILAARGAAADKAGGHIRRGPESDRPAFQDCPSTLIPILVGYGSLEQTYGNRHKP